MIADKPHERMIKTDRLNDLVDIYIHSEFLFGQIKLNNELIRRYTNILKSVI